MGKPKMLGMKVAFIPNARADRLRGKKNHFTIQGCVAKKKTEVQK